MTNSCTALEFPVAELAGTPAVYAIHFRGRLPTEIGVCLQEYWRLAWERAGRSVPPALVILDSDIQLRIGLGDEELRAVGLLRIKGGQ
jgi:hypothetical protein